MGESTLTSVPITEDPAFKRGLQHGVANGVKTPDIGERKFTGHMEDGFARSLTVQICAANKRLMSVSKIAKAGGRVVLDDDGNYIEDKQTKERIWMTENQCMYSIKMWVKSGDAGAPVFSRQRQ